MYDISRWGIRCAFQIHDHLLENVEDMASFVRCTRSFHITSPIGLKLCVDLTWIDPATFAPAVKTVISPSIVRRLVFTSTETGNHYHSIVNKLTQGRSGIGAYAGAARRRVHLAPVLLRPPFGHRPGRRQVRHAHILQTGLRLAIAQSDARPGVCDVEAPSLKLVRGSRGRRPTAE